LITQAILYGLLLGVTLSFMVGPVFLVLLDTSIRKGVKAAIALDLGVIVADILFISFAFFSTGFLEMLENSKLPYYIGGALITCFGVYSLVKSPVGLPTNTAGLLPEKVSYWGLALKGFLLNFLNVGVLTYWLTMSMIISHDFEYATTPVVTFFVSSVLAYFITDVIKIYFASKLQRYMTPPRMRFLERAVGVILVGFGVVVAFANN
jgi:threonine/homoserine/homoserine lactone efflux protein